LDVWTPRRAYGGVEVAVLKFDALALMRNSKYKVLKLSSLLYPSTHPVRWSTIFEVNIFFRPNPTSLNSIFLANIHLAKFRRRFLSRLWPSLGKSYTSGSIAAIVAFPN
jgi:hypothetical protein